MPQIIPLLTLTLVHTWYEMSTPMCTRTRIIKKVLEGSKINKKETLLLQVVKVPSLIKLTRNGGEVYKTL